MSGTNSHKRGNNYISILDELEKVISNLNIGVIVMSIVFWLFQTEVV